MIVSHQVQIDNARILIVEDECLIAEDIHETLTGLGYTVQGTATTSEEALDAMEHNEIDLVLMDIRIKGNIDGIETARRLRERFGIPVVYLTAHSDSATLNRAKQTEPLGYLIKPFQKKDIRATLEIAVYKAEMERQLRESEERLRLIVNNVSALISRIDTEGRYTFVNDAYEKWFSKPKAEIIGLTMKELLGPELYTRAAPYFERALGGEVVTFENSTLERSAQITFAPTQEAGKRCVYAVVIDITARIQLEYALIKEKERLYATLYCIGDGVIAVDGEARIEFMNPVAEQLTAWSTADATGLPLQQVFQLVDQRTREPVWAPFAIALEQGKLAELPADTLLLSRDGVEYMVEDSIAPLRGDGEVITGAVIVFRDVTKECETRSRIDHQSRHDALTGLINRYEFERLAQLLLQTARDESRLHCLIYLDLDQFKIVNDTCGHSSGDELLRQVTHLMGQQLRKSDILARLGGDEFGILLLDCPPGMAEDIAQSLINTVTAFRFVCQDKIFAIGASAGLVFLDTSAQGLKEALIAADAACYIAKERGRGRIQVFKDGDAAITSRREQISWVTRITRMLEEDRFRLYWQSIVPMIASNGDDTRFAEILLRLKEVDGEIIPPMAFLPAAERFNLMPRLDRWVIHNALKQIARQNVAQTKHSWRFSINLSGASLNEEGLLDYILEELVCSHADPSSITFEITETIAIANMAQAIHLMTNLKVIGCHFALDDFGSGVSSFNYLKQLPVDYLKIDGNLVRSIADDTISYLMVEAINRIGHAMGMKTIAEWVENAEVLNKIQELGVDYGQGYCLEMPVPLEQDAFGGA